MGTSGILLAQIPGFPGILAAQVMAGMIGLGGGLTYASLLNAMGGKVSRRQSAQLAAAWAVSLVLGVTPLFFVSGSATKIVVLAFYSFAVCGVIGGLVTGRIVKRLFPKVARHDLLPPLVTWSISLGIAAAASDAVGEALKAVLPDWAAWVLAYEAMVLMIGCGGGYAVALLLQETRPNEAAPTGILPDATAAQKKPGYRITVLALLCLPFYLNDIADIFIKDWRLWLLIDYVGVKLFPLLVVWSLILGGKMGLAQFGFTHAPARSFWSAFLVGTLAGLFLEQNGYAIISGLPGDHVLGGMPAITDPLWNWIDLTAGLLLVGILEELIFRGYLCTFLFRYTRRAVVIIGISALAFGLIHWSGGGHKVLVTALTGAVFMALYLRTQSLPALMLSHFVINFIAFADIIPKSIFRFL